jgi:hypothetical protein
LITAATAIVAKKLHPPCKSLTAKPTIYAATAKMPDRIPQPFQTNIIQSIRVTWAVSVWIARTAGS